MTENTMGHCHDCIFFVGDYFDGERTGIEWLAQAQGFGLCKRHTDPKTDDPSKFLLAIIVHVHIVPTVPEVIVKGSFGCVLFEPRSEEDK